MLGECKVVGHVHNIWVYVVHGSQNISNRVTSTGVAGTREAVVDGGVVCGRHEIVQGSAPFGDTKRHTHVYYRHDRTVPLTMDDDYYSIDSILAENQVGTNISCDKPD